MSKAVRLRAGEREFLARLARVIFANPFTTETTELEALVGRGPKPTPGDHALAVLAPVLDERLQKLEARGVSRIGKIAAEDRHLLEYGYLFQAYDRFIEPFDALIQSQIDQGDQPAEVPFAGDLIRLLKGRGFAEDNVMRLMALFYQIRRAYFFIGRQPIHAETPSCAVGQRLHLRHSRLQGAPLEPDGGLFHSPAGGDGHRQGYGRRRHRSIRIDSFRR